MFVRKILLALAMTTPCIGHASFIASEDDGSSTFGSFTGTTSQGGTLVLRPPGNSQIVTQVGSSNAQTTPPAVIPPEPTPVVSWQVGNTSTNDVLPVDPDPGTDPNAAALIRIGGSAPSVIIPAIREPLPSLSPIPPVGFEIILAPSAVPESSTTALWALGAIGILLASKRKGASSFC